MTIETLKQHMGRIIDLRRAASVLNWDQETLMPPGGAEARAQQMTTLRSMAHELFTRDEMGQLLTDLQDHSYGPDSDEAALVRVLTEDYQQAVKVPVEWVEENTRLTSLAHHTWVEARTHNAFERFADHLRRLFELQRQWAGFFVPYDDIYDPLLDKFQRGTSYAQIAAIFADLKPRLIELSRRIQEVAGQETDILRRELDPQKQFAFGGMLAAAVGYDFTHGRLDLSAHPFTTRLDRSDVRITTRIVPGDFFYCLKSSLHEAGHAIHSQNNAASLMRTGLEGSGGTAVSESQSRFYENILGRSLPFWRYMFPQMQAFFAPKFDDITVEDFYRAINRVQPSLIRVQADEVTYGLHVMLRFEIEHGVMNGSIAVDDLPEVWNSKMKEYLGIVPPTDTDGVLQDIHWSMGLYGYFPGYLLGSILSVQLWEAMQQAHPDVVSEIERGQFDTVLSWLREHVMQHGRKFTLPQITERAVGGPLSAEPFITYLEEKFGSIYGL